MSGGGTAGLGLWNHIGNDHPGGLGGGTTDSYYLLCSVTALSSDGTARVGGGTTSTLEIWDETLFCSNFEAIRAYKYSTIFYKKR